MVLATLYNMGPKRDDSTQDFLFQRQVLLSFCFGYLKGKGQEPVDWNRKDCKYKKSTCPWWSKVLKAGKEHRKRISPRMDKPLRPWRLWEWDVYKEKRWSEERRDTWNSYWAWRCLVSPARATLSTRSWKPQRTEETVSLAGTWNSVLLAFFA